MNALYEGLPFEIETRYPLILNTVFSTLLYSSGLPALIPLALFSLVISFLVDKYSCTGHVVRILCTSVAQLSIVLLLQCFGCTRGHLLTMKALPSFPRMQCHLRCCSTFSLDCGCMETMTC